MCWRRTFLWIMYSSLSTISSHFITSREIDWERNWWVIFIFLSHCSHKHTFSIFFLEHHDSLDKFSIDQNERIYKRLCEVINMHNDAIEMCALTSKTLWKNIFFLFVSSSLVICISCLMIIKSVGADRMVFILYLCAYILQIFVYSACGNLLIDSSLKVNDAAYNFQWYKCNVKIRKAIYLIMLRAQRKVNIHVPFFEVSLETFSWVRNIKLFWFKSQNLFYILQVMRLGGSFITLIKAFL